MQCEKPAKCPAAGCCTLISHVIKKINKDHLSINIHETRSGDVIKLARGLLVTFLKLDL